jgi:hypothetical protein
MSAQDHIVASGANSSGQGPENVAYITLKPRIGASGVGQGVEHASRGYEGELAGNGDRVVQTGRFTGRFVVNLARSKAQATGLCQRMQCVPLRRGSLRAGLLRRRQCGIRQAHSRDRRVRLAQGLAIPVAAPPV